jgi:hypothetical protein
MFDVGNATTAPSKAGAGRRVAWIDQDPSSVMICPLSPPGERDGERGFL